MKKFLSLLCALALSAPQAFAVGKVQQQGIKTLSDCTAAGATGATCLPLTSQIWDSLNGQQLSSSIANGQLGGGGGGAGTNYLSDANLQQYPTGSYWTVTNGTGAADTTNFTDSKQSIQVTASSQQAVLSQSVTPSSYPQLSGTNMQATMWVKTSLTNVQVCALVGGVSTNCQSVASNNSWAPYTATFIGPSSGTFGVQVGMTSSGTGTFNAQLGYVGKAVQTAMLSQAQLYGTITWSATSTNLWQVTSSSYSNFPASSSLTSSVTGNASAPSTQVPGITFASMPPGDYYFVATGFIGCSGSSTTCKYRFSDGTNVSDEMGGFIFGSNLIAGYSPNGHITYTTGQSNVTVQLQALTNGSSANIQTYEQNGGSQAYPVNFTIKVYYFPSAQQQGYRADATPASWSGYHNNSCTFSTSTALPSYGNATNSNTSCALMQRNNRNFGTVTSYGGSGASALPGIVFTPPRAGNYYVCASVNANNNGTNDVMAFQLNDGSGTVIDAQGSQVDTANNQFQFKLCGVYNAATTASTTIRVQTGSSGGNTTYIQGINSTLNPIEWSIFELDAPMPAPYLTGSVTSNTSAGEHIERATIAQSAACTSSPCTINSQSGSWLTSVTRTTTGSYVLNIAAGEFSSAPTCTISTNEFTSYVSAGTQTSTSFPFFTSTSGGNTDAQNFNVICMGPR